MIDVNKIIIPAGGLGTRFLPYTKSIPKEMLPILNKPLIQYVIEESIASEVNNFFIVTSKSKKMLADYIDTAPGLEAILKERNQEDLLRSTDRLARLGSYAYIRQAEPLGVGHALLLIKNYLSKEHFCVALPDDLFFAQEPALQQLIRIARQEKGCVLAVKEVPNHLISEHTIVSIKKNISPQLVQVNTLVHRPQPKDAPSNLAVIGRYVLSHKIFPAIDYLNDHRDEHELSLHEAISHMAQTGERVFAYQVKGDCHHIDTPLSLLRATIAFGLQNPLFSSSMRTLLDEFSAHATACPSFERPATEEAFSR